MLRVHYKSSTSEVTYDTPSKPKIGKIHSLYLRWTNVSTVVYFDDVIVSSKFQGKLTASPTSIQPIYFGSLDGTQEYCKCYIYDIEYNNLALPAGVQRTHDENISLFNRTQTEKTQSLSMIPSVPTAGSSYGEGTLIIKNDIFYNYHSLLVFSL